MSFDAFKWARGQGGLSSNRKFVLLMIADHYNEADRCAWPSMSTLARETGMSRRSVVRCIADLEATGLLEAEQWINWDTGKQMANRYYLPQYDPESRRLKPTVAGVSGFGLEGRMEYERMDPDALYG
jgi:AraC-like DNA-binding protein